tara:strand:+ start:489 stop:1196 length:708 start_codon:yes stop_codon:yes gene_type:complete
MNNLSVVLCTYNEEKSIKSTLKKLIKSNMVNEIIIVDDNSQDKTIKVIKEFKSKKIRLYVRKNVRGFASALNHGIKLSKFNYILRFDVDMSLNINYFLKKFKKYKKKDCIIFSRYVKSGKDLRGNFRKLSSLILNKICNFLLSSEIKDFTSCIMIFNKKILKDVEIENTAYANFIIKFIFLLIKKKKNFIELPYIQNRDTQENSKSAPNLITFIKNGLLYFFTIIECYFIKIKKF